MMTSNPALSPRDIGAVATLLTKMQGREFDDGDYDLWFEMLNDLDGSLVMEATKALIRDTDVFITPARIRERATMIANSRLRAAGGTLPEPPSGLSEPEYRAWLRAQRAAVARGASAEEVTAAAAAAINRQPELPAPRRGQAPLAQVRRVSAQGHRVDAAAGDGSGTAVGRDAWASDTGPYQAPGGGSWPE